MWYFAVISYKFKNLKCYYYEYLTSFVDLKFCLEGLEDIEEKSFTRLTNLCNYHCNFEVLYFQISKSWKTNAPTAFY